jgi:hypothetical protein
MKHLAFYYAVGFAVVGCLMLTAGLSIFIWRPYQNNDTYGLAVLVTTMLLPFMISILSWRDWKEVERKNETQPET